MVSIKSMAGRKSMVNKKAILVYERKVKIPEKVQVEVKGRKVKVSGEKGTVEREFKATTGIGIEKNDETVRVFADSSRRKQKAVAGSIAAHIKNMINGVMDGYTAELKVVYSHFPVTVKVEGDKVLIQNFLGEKMPRIARIMGDETKVEVNGADITVSGPDIEAVGQTAANMEQATRIREHDRKVFQDGVYITKKPKG